MYIVLRGCNDFCTDSLKEAEDVFFETCNATEFVELVEVFEGQSGHLKGYISLRRSW